MLHLGIVLMELCFNAPFERQPLRQKYLGPDNHPTISTGKNAHGPGLEARIPDSIGRMAAVELRKCYGRSWPKVRHSPQLLPRLSFRPTEPDLSSPAFRQTVHANVSFRKKAQVLSQI